MLLDKYVEFKKKMVLLHMFSCVGKNFGLIDADQRFHALSFWCPIAIQTRTWQQINYCPENFFGKANISHLDIKFHCIFGKEKYRILQILLYIYLWEVWPCVMMKHRFVAAESHDAEKTKTFNFPKQITIYSLHLVITFRLPNQDRFALNCNCKSNWNQGENYIKGKIETCQTTRC